MNRASPDEIQYHMLGVINMLMTTYSLSIEQIQQHIDYINSFPPNQVIHDYETFLKIGNNYVIQPVPSDASSTVSSNHSCSTCKSEEDDVEMSEDMLDDNGLIYVRSRREFCNAMAKGIKICSKYSTCQDINCKNFHIEKKYLCPHNPKSSYCDHDDCELIVIKPCRRGASCKDSQCSFRH